MRTQLLQSKLAIAVLFAAATLPAAAQKPTSGPSSTVVYVGGNDLVLKASDGKLLNFTVPSGVKFTCGGKQVSLSDLHAGSQLTAPVVTGFEPQIVSSVTVVKGKVYAVTPPDGVTLLLSEGVKELSVPSGTTFMVDGKPLKTAELKPDMMVQATIVTTAADATAASASATPPMSGSLLVAKTAAADDMPSAATNLPLYGIVGALMLLLGCALFVSNWRPARQV
jgi:hypothetical protein